MNRIGIVARVAACAALLLCSLPSVGGAQSLSVALGRAVAKQFSGQPVFIVSTTPCFASGGNCEDYPDASKGLDLVAVTRELPNGVLVTSRERGGALPATRTTECEIPLRCSVIGFVLLPPGSDSSIVRYKVMSSAVRGARPRVAFVADYIVELKRKANGWEVLSIKLDRLS